MAESSLAPIYRAVRQRLGGGGVPRTATQENTTKLGAGIRMSGTRTVTLQEVDSHPQDGPIDEDNPIGRQGNEWTYPDFPRGISVINQDPWDRLQSFANSTLSEGPTPGRIPRMWNFRTNGKVGRDITGNPSGDTSAPITLTGDSAGGIGDMKWIPHVQIPRGTSMARTYLRTVDDSAAIPGVFIADATWH
jgi:hypothetical protein